LNLLFGKRLTLLSMKVFNLYGDDWDRMQDREGWRATRRPAVFDRCLTRRASS
jgi:hypothetical protein